MMGAGCSWWRRQAVSFGLVALALAAVTGWLIALGAGAYADGSAGTLLPSACAEPLAIQEPYNATSISAPCRASLHCTAA